MDPGDLLSLTEAIRTLPQSWTGPPFLLYPSCQAALGRVVSCWEGVLQGEDLEGLGAAVLNQLTLRRLLSAALLFIAVPAQWTECPGCWLGPHGFCSLEPDFRRFGFRSTPTQACPPHNNPAITRVGWGPWHSDARCQDSSTPAAHGWPGGWRSDPTLCSSLEGAALSGHWSGQWPSLLCPSSTTSPHHSVSAGDAFF